MADAKGKTLPDPESFEGSESEPVVAWATIVKNKSDDGMFEVDPKYVGARIAINLRTTTYGTMYNITTKQYHRREIIYKIDPITDWIPTELLEIEL